MRKQAFLLLLVTSAVGCGPTYTPLATHTLKVSDHVEQDVVWVLQRGDAVVRCSNTDKGPVCIRAQNR